MEEYKLTFSIAPGGSITTTVRSKKEAEDAIKFIMRDLPDVHDEIAEEAAEEGDTVVLRWYNKPGVHCAHVIAGLRAWGLSPIRADEIAFLQQIELTAAEVDLLKEKLHEYVNFRY